MQFEGIITESETSCTHLEVELSSELSNVCNGFLNGFEFLTFFHPGHCLVLLSILKKLCYITKISPTFSVEKKKPKDLISSLQYQKWKLPFFTYLLRERHSCALEGGGDVSQSVFSEDQVLESVQMFFCPGSSLCK